MIPSQGNHEPYDTEFRKQYAPVRCRKQLVQGAQMQLGEVEPAHGEQTNSPNGQHGEGRDGPGELAGCRRFTKRAPPEQCGEIP